MKFDDNANQVIGAVGKPPFLYGTAWKKENTTRLVKEALSAGFRAIDTAAQPKHYREDLVGNALRETYEGGSVTREQLFVCRIYPCMEEKSHY
jgi:diketogulonate reductase-like aldo/keto reductase